MTSSPDARLALGKVMVVLHAFGQEDHILSLAELVRRTGPTSNSRCCDCWSTAVM